MRLKRSRKEIERLEKNAETKSFPLSEGNSVSLDGKISKLSRLAYTPGGEPVIELTLAVAQSMYGKQTMGYFPVVMTGNLAEEASPVLRVGKRIRIEGQLWNRVFLNRKGSKTVEFKIVAAQFGGAL